ncbi:MAG: hypothetical protein ACE15B_14125 [Bryobacteraceae bacterium]
MKCLIVVMAAAMLLPAGLFAEGVTVRADIPFQFLAGDQVLPAGSYQVRFDPEFRKIQFHSPESTATLFLLTKSFKRPEGAQADTGLLVFHKYGNVYALRNVWNPRQAKGYAAPVSKVERELARRMPAGEAAVGTH